MQATASRSNNSVDVAVITQGDGRILPAPFFLFGLAALADVILRPAYVLGIERRPFLGQAHKVATTDTTDQRTHEL